MFFLPLCRSWVSSVGKKTPKWFYAVLILIPIVILFLLELGLRIFNYGYNTEQWVDAGNGKYIINPEIGKRYFNPKFVIRK